MRRRRTPKRDFELGEFGRLPLGARIRGRLRRTSPRTRAAIMSFFLPGLGQAYVDQIARAVVWLLGIVLLNVVLRNQVQGWQTAAFVLSLNVLAAIDAALVAPSKSQTDQRPR